MLISLHVKIGQMVLDLDRKTADTHEAVNVVILHSILLSFQRRKVGH